MARASDLFPSAPEGYFLRNYDRRWPSWKFGMRQDELFTTLARRCNSITLPVLDVEAFNRDVCELSATAQDRDDFLHLLDERRDLRQKELLDLWQLSFTQIAASPALLSGSNTRWKDAIHIYHSKSFDAYVRYFAGFLPSQPRPPSLRSPPVDQSTARPTPPSTGGLTSTPVDLQAEPELFEMESTGTIRTESKKPKTIPPRKRSVEKWRKQDKIVRRSARIQQRQVAAGHVDLQRTSQGTPRQEASRIAKVRKGSKPRPR
ncbi:hypothetical protein DHEL01_v211611 [Diaporthe helianthi]|uniref:Uncharacterized protein n=1 Tax=Diaporthe helianthi TaxID=158607 RepID=A0A2P5HIC7_DIAHE|nr:hypothetical protein DHEL01_v211611 [Diaporthe helianthi]